MKKTRLQQIITDKSSYDNVIQLYNSLRGQENLDLKLFLKTLVYAADNAQKGENPERWVTPNIFFSPTTQYNFSLDYLKELYNNHIAWCNGHGWNVFEENTKEAFGKLC